MEAACSRARMQPLESKSGFSDRTWRRHLRGSLRPGRPLLSCPTSALWAGARTALGSGAGGGALDLDHRSVEESLAADVLNHYVGPVDARFASPLSGLLSTLIPSSAAIRDYGEPQVNSPCDGMWPPCPLRLWRLRESKRACRSRAGNGKIVIIRVGNMTRLPGAMTGQTSCCDYG